MRCSKCGSDNREGRRFCRKCGSKLGTVCPKCGAANEPDEDFCGDCGAALNPPAEAVAAPTQITPSGERRHLTVLFCDLVGSTEIAAQLDPEEWRETVAHYHRKAAEAITRYGGHVAKFLGDAARKTSCPLDSQSYSFAQSIGPVWLLRTRRSKETARALPLRRLLLRPHLQHSPLFV